MTSRVAEEGQSRKANVIKTFKAQTTESLNDNMKTSHNVASQTLSNP